ncbi:DUF1499 domain-containing protein [Lignipirellula cremea]|uniref:DUF1499 domain-containing protein n=1 Tax=Lignipirellula cremea TaxID=2528010 RepID=A0A518E3L1_9BACT|nr:DUF1499 domain-containing protein [Lignipirellula cremea]QDU98674.1 hypothetical protein Pla8534_65460 [Lignipirellula cremea]
MKRRRMWIYLAVAAAISLAVVLLFLATTINDWSRDFTTNTAAMDSPLESSQSPAALAAMVRSAVDELPRWSLVEEDTTDQASRLHFTRTTALFRFVDDIRVTITPTATGSQLTARSQSRVGKGDLGQNPRNLQELLTALDRQQPTP